MFRSSSNTRAIALVAMLVAPSAHAAVTDEAAQGPTEASVAQASRGAVAAAEDALRRGVELRRAHRDADALVEFRRAYALSPTGRALAQIALAHEALGQWVDADRELAAALASTDPWVEKNRGTLESAQQLAAQKLGSILVTSNVAGASVRVDGESLAAADGALRVLAGEHRVDVDAPGFVGLEKRLSVAPGTVAHVHFELASAVVPKDKASAQPPVTQAVSSRALERRALDDGWLLGGLVAVGAGVTATAFGVYFGVSAAAEKRERDAACSGRTCSPEGLAHDERARTDATLATVCFAAGLPLVIAGTWITLRPPTAKPVTVQPSVGQSGLGITFSGAF